MKCFNPIESIRGEQVLVAGGITTKTMPLIAKLVDKKTAALLKNVSPSITSPEDFLSRCNIVLSNELKCDIHEVQQMKLQIAGKLLVGDDEIMALSWLDFQTPIPLTSSYLESVPRPTGFQLIDDSFNGGLPPSRMIELLGASNSGKTQFCMSTALACARIGLKVLILNVNNDISIYRIRRLLDFHIAQDRLLITEDQRHDAKSFVLSNIFIQPVYDIWSCMDLLCRVAEKTALYYDLVVVDSLYSLFSPYLTVSGGGSSLYTSSSVSAKMTSNNFITSSVTTTTVSSVSYQPLVANLYLLLRKLVTRGMTVLTTNVLERDRNTSYSSNNNQLNRNMSVNASYSALKLPNGVGTAGCNSDVFDIIFVLNRNDSEGTEMYTSFIANIALRPPQFSMKPSICEFRVAKI